MISTESALHLFFGFVEFGKISCDQIRVSQNRSVGFDLTIDQVHTFVIEKARVNKATPNKGENEGCPQCNKNFKLQPSTLRFFLKGFGYWRLLVRVFCANS